jgi:hypothetical protein
MPKLAFPVAPAGLTVPVLIGLDGQTTTALRSAGQAVRPPVLVRGLLDSGTNITSIAAPVLQHLGLAPTSAGTTHTAGGAVSVNLFTVSLSITDPSQPGSPWLTQTDLLVMELAALLPDAEVLIGLDVLLKYKLVLDGPGGKFTLEF